MQECGFFNGDYEYGQDEFNRYFENLFESGGSIDDNGEMTLKVTAGTNAVTVSKGFAIIKGFYDYNDSDLVLPIVPDANYERIDRIVVRVNRLSGPVEIVVKAGAAGSNPKAPELQRSDNVWEISLAKISVRPNGSVEVTDERFDSSVCGAIRPKNLTEYKAMVTEFQKQFDKWFDAQQGKGWRNIFIQPDNPEGSVTGSIWIQEQ